MKTRLILVAVAVITAAAMLLWHFLWEKPRQDCAKQGGVWDEHAHMCARTVSIAPVLGPPDPR
jgi:hypothetical protein